MPIARPFSGAANSCVPRVLRFAAPVAASESAVAQKEWPAFAGAKILSEPSGSHFLSEGAGSVRHG